jgi:tetratricopeptide (TPR) repeat protein
MKRAEESRRRVWAYRIGGILLPFVLVALVEVAFRIAGVARPEPLFLEVKTETFDKFQTNPNVAQRDFPPSLARILPRPGFQVFDAVKPEGTLRIFCLGASTTAGFPFPAHLAFPSLLNEKLRLYLPDRRVEVINCGVSAVSSFTLVDFTREVLRHAPDLVILYAGHNEFYGAWGAAATGALANAPDFVVDFVRWFRRLRIVRWLTQKMGEPEIAPGTLMERMIGQAEVPPEGRLRQRALRNYRRNLRKIIRMCKRAGVPLVLCEPVCNLRDHYPFASLVHEEEASRARRLDLWEKERAAQAEDAALEEAYRFWQGITASDSLAADLWFHGARLEERRHDWDAALRAYEKARDLDLVPFRATSDLLAALRELAREEDVPLVPLEQVFRGASRGRAPGKNLFLEHVHPNLRGQVLLAEAICRTLAEIPWPDAETTWQWEADPGPWEILQMAGLTPLDAIYAELRIRQLLDRWPYRAPDPTKVSGFQRFMEADPLRTYEPARVFKEARGLWTGARQSGALAEAEFEEAIPWPEEPDSVVLGVAERVLKKQASILEAHERQGEHFVHQRKWPEAFREYRTAIRLFPVDPENYLRAGQVLLAGGQLERARSYLQAGLAWRPGHPEIMLTLAETERRLGNARAAQAWAQQVLLVDPGNRGAQRILEQVRPLLEGEGGQEP